MPVGEKEIANRFGYHPGTEKTIPQHQRLRESFIAFANFLDEVLPDGRPKSTAMTKLQETSMWANFGVAEQAGVILPTEEAAMMVKIGLLDENVRATSTEEQASPKWPN